MNELKSGASQKASGSEKAANDRLALLKQRENLIMEMVRKKKSKKLIDNSVKEELDALTQYTPTSRPGSPIYLRQKNLSQKREPKQLRQLNKKLKKLVARHEKNKKIHHPKILNKTDVSSSDHTLMNILRSVAKTAEEKYRVLDARDRFYQSRRSLHKKQRLIGICPDMCPEKERLRRCYQAQVSVFEIKNSEVNEEWMVKEYARSSADQDTPLPHDLRPVPVLQRTMAHLCRNVADYSEDPDQSLDDWYMFMWDRTRAIRKDLTHQDVCSKSAVVLLEQCARFHIHCAERLVDQDLSVYDDKINTENLTKCLQTLKYMYNDLRSMGLVCDNAAEFLSYSLLLNLNNSAIMTEIRNMPEDVILSQPIRFALDVITARDNKNYIRFFSLLKNTTYLNGCILRRYLSEMRVHAFTAMVRAHCRRRAPPVPVPVPPLVESLMFESVSECMTHLKLCNLSIQNRDGLPHVILDMNAFRRPDEPFSCAPSYQYVRPKKTVVLSELIWGGLLGPFESKPLQCSFTAFDEFKMDTISWDQLNTEESVIQVDSGKIDDAVVLSDDEIENVEDDEVLIIADDEFEETSQDAEIMEPLPEHHLPATDRISPVMPSVRSDNPAVSSILETAPVEVESEEIDDAVPVSVNEVFNLTPSLPNMERPVRDEKLKDSISSYLFSPTLKNKNKEEYDNLTEIKKRVSTLEEKQLHRAKLEREMEWKQRLRSQEEEQFSKRSREDAEGRTRIEMIRRRELEKKQLLAEERLKEEERQLRMNLLEELKQKRDRENAIKMANESKIMAAQNEEKRRSTLNRLRVKYRMWKLRVFANRWRCRASATSDARKLEEYIESLSALYPPICEADLLDGNPWGVIIPTILQVRRRNLGLRHIPSGFSGGDGPTPMLPLVDIGRVVAASLTQRVRALYPDPAAPFRSHFPWKLVISLPACEETAVRLDTFLEMHFVDRFDWKFGSESSPLCYGIHKMGNIELNICVRRIKGVDCYEGDSHNRLVLQGANSMLFFLTDDSNSLSFAKQRLHNIRNLPGGAKLPVVAFVFGNRLPESAVRGSLRLCEDSQVVTCGGASQQSLVTTLSRSLCLCASLALPVPAARSVRLSALFPSPFLPRLWHQCHLAVSSLNVSMPNPQPLISFYNNCLENLLDIFSNQNNKSLSCLAPEFEGIVSKMESLSMVPIPVIDESYRTQLAKVWNDLKLPEWPKRVVRSTNDLNYQLNLYAKIITKDSSALKNLKWRVYQVIKDKLLWKGMDIYCDEDIETVLAMMPWVDVLKEFSHSAVQKAIIRAPDIALIYDPQLTAHFCDASPILVPATCFKRDEESLELEPKPERDSIRMAYASLLELQNEEAEATKDLELSLSEQVSLILETSLPQLSDSCDMSCDQTRGSLKRSFEAMEETVAQLKNSLEKRRKVFDDVLQENSG